MKNLVAGIVLVGLATLAFNLYMRGDSTSAPMLAQTQPAEQIAEIVPPQSKDESRTEPARTQEPSEPKPTTSASKRPLPHAERTVTSRRPAFARDNSPAVFADKIIYYHVPVQKKSAVTAVAPQRTVVTVRKKRSVLAKTFNVVKKPYDWVKHVVTQL